ncbi:hypothetical protein BH23ACT10_BH23ACT10_00540 [soil metagenome]
MTQPDTADHPPPGSRFTFGARPTVGAAAAVKAVAQDTSELVRAEIDLAKAELTHGIKANAIGAGLLIGAAVMMWLAVQGLLIAAGFALALVVPGWAAALIVAVVLLIVGGVLAKIGLGRLGTPVSVDQTKANVAEDVAWFKTHLQSR